jgi:hypothetical protein
MIVTPTVRTATHKDEADLLRLIKEAHVESGMLGIDEDSVVEMLRRAFNKKGGLIGVIDAKNEIAAAIYLLFSRFWYSRDDHLEELFNYCRPSHRRSNHAVSLIEFAKQSAKVCGIPLVIGVLTSHRMEAKVRLYRRKLGTPAGAFFVFNAQHWDNDTSPNSDLWHSHSRGGKKRNGVLHTESIMTTSPLPMLPLVPPMN